MRVSNRALPAKGIMKKFVTASCPLMFSKIRPTPSNVYFLILIAG